ncbi:MAG: hypothetical protein R2831_02570 [Chitinophagaceae bacterium]
MLLFIFSLSANAAILRVNNTPGILGVHTHLQNAVNVANAGDTIYIEPSDVAYSGAAIAKKITIIGNGSELATNKEFQAIDKTAIIAGNVDLQSGANDSYLSLTIAGNILVNGVNNFTIDNCNIQGRLVIENATNALIRRTLVKGTASQTLGLTVDLSNHIRFQNTAFEVKQTISNSTNITFANCNFRNVQFTSFTQATFIACIFIEAQLNQAAFDATCTLFHCIHSQSYSSTIPSGISEDVIFLPLNQILVNSSSTDGFEKNITINNIEPNDVGIYAGEYPLKKATIPAIPTIYSLEMNSYNSSNSLQINLKSRSNK